MDFIILIIQLHLYNETHTRLFIKTDFIIFLFNHKCKMYDKKINNFIFIINIVTYVIQLVSPFSKKILHT